MLILVVANPKLEVLAQDEPAPQCLRIAEGAECLYLDRIQRTREWDRVRCLYSACNANTNSPNLCLAPERPPQLVISYFRHVPSGELPPAKLAFEPNKLVPPLSPLYFCFGDDFLRSFCISRFQLLTSSQRNRLQG